MATAAGWLARRAGLPAIVGYLAIGLLVSPFTPGYAVNREQLHTFADIGVARAHRSRRLGHVR
jgi:CPA2 family monovalent cation:H+ antiporter-2